MDIKELLMAVITSSILPSSNLNKESISNNKIVGTWKSSTQVTITFGSDGSYYRTLGPEGLHTYHKGSYSYNEDHFED